MLKEVVENELPTILKISNQIICQAKMTKITIGYQLLQCNTLLLFYHCNLNCLGLFGRTEQGIFKPISPWPEGNSDEHFFCFLTLNKLNGLNNENHCQP